MGVGVGSNVHSWAKYGTFFGLVATTGVSTFLLVGDMRHWTLSQTLYRLVVTNRATTQIVIQVLSQILGLVHVTVVCRLVNYATRLRLNKVPVSLNMVRLWSDICSPRMNWELPFRLTILLLCFLSLTAVPPALWAGALTPISTLVVRDGTVRIPQYSNVTLIKEYPSEIGLAGPSHRDRRGLVTYSVGTQLQGPLLLSASLATTPDGSIRKHGKIDNSRFTYYGRSYGVGASAGLVDDDILGNELATAYSYQEIGYKAVTTCIYNLTSQFQFRDLGLTMLYAATGPLPNSVDAEYSVYVGHDTSALFAIGVSHIQTPGRVLAIAAGESYAALNKTQCTLDFIPTLFNVSVGLRNREINVTAVSRVAEFDPSGNVTWVTMRQFELISNDQTNIYTSLVGDSFLASIHDYNTSRANDPSHLPTEQEATIAGLTNSINSMVDDMLVGYASAQLMIGHDSVVAPASIQLNALRLGQGMYIYAIATVNTFVVLLVVVEAFRTDGWRNLLAFDYMDPGYLIIGSSKGGKGIAKAANTACESWKASRLSWWQESTNAAIGRLSVVLDGGQAVVMGNRREGYSDEKDSPVLISKASPYPQSWI